MGDRYNIHSQLEHLQVSIEVYTANFTQVALRLRPGNDVQEEENFAYNNKE
jgi:hypothetical protein